MRIRRTSRSSPNRVSANCRAGRKLVNIEVIILYIEFYLSLEGETLYLGLIVRRALAKREAYFIYTNRKLSCDTATGARNLSANSDFAGYPLNAASPGPSPNKAPAVTRAIAILRLIAASPNPLGLTEIARDLALIPSTCFHLLRALESEGFVECGPRKKYGLGSGLSALGNRELGADNFADKVRPILKMVSMKFRTTAVSMQLHGQDNAHFIVVAAALPDVPFPIKVEVGRITPRMGGAKGRCFAAFSGVDEVTLAEEFATLNWDSSISFDQWLNEVHATRRQGFAVDRGKHMRGFSVIAAPIFACGTFCRTISSIYANEQLDDQQVAELTLDLTVAAHALSTFEAGAALPVAPPKPRPHNESATVLAV